MLDLPTRFAALIITLAPLVIQRSWLHARMLLITAILTLELRAVASGPWTAGHARYQYSTIYKRVLSRAPRNALSAGCTFLGHVIWVSALRGPVIVGVDDTIERRWMSRISARGFYRDPMRSLHSHFLETSGLGWIRLMLLASNPRAGRVWELPFLTALVPPERYNVARERRHKMLDFGRQARRWLPGRDLVADSSFRSLQFLSARRRHGLTVIKCMRLDAALGDPASPHAPGAMGRPRKAGKRLPTLTKGAADVPIAWNFVRVEHWYGGRVREVQVASAVAVWRHYGLIAVPVRCLLIRKPAKPDATQRRWSDHAIPRTTPRPLTLFSIVTVLAGPLAAWQRRSTTVGAWYPKARHTFFDAPAAMRRASWREQHSPNLTEAHRPPNDPLRLPVANLGLRLLQRDLNGPKSH